MDSWDSQTSTSTPQVKFENSPVESFISTPGGEMYPSLFGTSSVTNASESVMTPQSYTDDYADGACDDAEGTPGPDSDKKTTKKRKSWGQVLPEPKTNLPPR
jgi:transcriptional activator HAC1